MKFLFKLIPLYSLLALIYLITTFAGVLPPEDGPALLVTSILNILTIVVGFTSTITSVFEHVSDIGKIRSLKQQVINADEYRQACQQHIDKVIKDDGLKLDENLLAKAQVDHPLVHAFREMNKAEKEYRETRDNLARRIGIIEARKSGPFSWVVDIYGDGGIGDAD